jgi:hypothetical protein
MLFFSPTLASARNLCQVLAARSLKQNHHRGESGMTIHSLLAWSLCIGLAAIYANAAAAKDDRVFEMRIYYAHPGKLNDLHARFRDHTTKLFEKHGMTNVGYWVPIDNPDNKLVYILAYPSRRLVAKNESMFLAATDYSPQIKPAAAGERVFELRTYTASKGNLELLHARFRDHTLKLFEKHGMTNIGYWSPIAGEKGADNTLVYILAHKSPDSAKASFDSFRKDPDWLAARKASEEKGGGSLTEVNGVKSEFMTATDYSTIR